MDAFKRSFLISFFLLLLISVSFIAGYLTRDLIGSSEFDFPILYEAYQIILENGFNPLPPDPAMEYGMIRGMLQAYGDPYTSFSEPAQHELQTNELQGSFGGIGAELGVDPEGYYLLYPYPDSPAAEAGIMEGDRLLAVDELQTIPNMPLEVVLAAIRGPVGERVLITISRPPELGHLEYRIEREEIPLPSVTWHLEPSEPRLGIIRVNLIAETTPDEIQNAVEDMQNRGATHFAMDLRDNYGGLLNSGIDIARLFLVDGTIISQQYREEDVEIFSVDSPGSLSDIPLLILVNENTASAAEIVAGSLQAHQRTFLIGTPTYGKDTIQLVFELQDGSSLHVTAAHWMLPGVYDPISGTGLQPDLSPSLEAINNIDPYISTAILYFFGNP